MVLEALRIEKEFIIEALPVSLIGMNSALMSQYLEFVADNLLEDLGLERYYKVSQPFKFMETIGLQTKTNFFEKRVSNYNKAETGGSISFDASF